MSEFFRQLLSTGFMAHVYCLRDPALIWLHAVSDVLTALSYFLIPVTLVRLVRRRTDLAFSHAYTLFGIFILACGATHVLAVVTLWYPVYRLEGVVKLITAIASMGTAIVLVRLLPVALAIPGPMQLKQEIELRRHAEAELNALNGELEDRVRERTGELEAANAHMAELVAILDKAQTIVQKLDGTILIWNSGSEALYGWSREEALGRKTHELLQTELPQPLEDIQRALLEHGSWKGEFRQQCKDGSSIWVASHWALQCDAAGLPSCVVKVNNDITALKRAGEALRTSEATALSLFENASQGILTVDDRGRIMAANVMVQTLFGYTLRELPGLPVEMLLPESLRGPLAGEGKGYWLQTHARTMGPGLSLTARRRDGSEFPAEISLSFVAGHREGLSMAFISDITAREQALEEREHLIHGLERALAEKTVMIKEVHHRVKNNLAVIAGLLGMQADHIEDVDAHRALQESQDRVSSMALIHEYLYATEYLDRVNFPQYLQRLADELCVSYAKSSGLVVINIGGGDLIGAGNIVMGSGDIELPVNRAIPCGLILNELLSNALKYAFPDGRAGRIEIRFARLESGTLVLSCQDDGVGLPATLDWKNPQTLGLRIVKMLTKQLDGTMKLDRSAGGAFFELSFPAG